MNEFEKIWNKLSPNVKGFIFILMASATFPIMGTIVKYLTLELHPFQLAFFRCFFGLIILIPIILKNKHSLKIDNFKFKCCVGKKGIDKEKTEGDKKTPRGIFGLEKLFGLTSEIISWIFSSWYPKMVSIGRLIGDFPFLLSLSLNIFLLVKVPTTA